MEYPSNKHHNGINTKSEPQMIPGPNANQLHQNHHSERFNTRAKPNGSGRSRQNRPEGHIRENNILPEDSIVRHSSKRVARELERAEVEEAISRQNRAILEQEKSKLEQHRLIADQREAQARQLHWENEMRDLESVRAALIQQVHDLTRRRDVLREEIHLLEVDRVRQQRLQQSSPRTYGNGGNPVEPETRYGNTHQDSAHNLDPDTKFAQHHNVQEHGIPRPRRQSRPSQIPQMERYDEVKSKFSANNIFTDAHEPSVTTNTRLKRQPKFSTMQPLQYSESPTQERVPPWTQPVEREIFHQAFRGEEDSREQRRRSPGEEHISQRHAQESRPLQTRYTVRQQAPSPRRTGSSSREVTAKGETPNVRSTTLRSATPVSPLQGPIPQRVHFDTSSNKSGTSSRRPSVSRPPARHAKTTSHLPMPLRSGSHQPPYVTSIDEEDTDMERGGSPCFAARDPASSWATSSARTRVKNNSRSVMRGFRDV